MGRSSGLWVLVCVGLLSSGQGQDQTCRVQDGIDGAAGAPGVDGRDGAKGGKGEPALSAAVLPGEAAALLKMKGERGGRGPAGEMGPKGYSGDLGREGLLGAPGRQGPPGESGGQSQQSRPAFSVLRTVNTFSGYNKKITFQKSITNTSADFDLDTGIFTCKEPGVYYFVFHSMSKTDMCLKLMSEALEERKLGFCDYSSRGTSQVLSGGVVLSLLRDQTVWLEMFKDQQKDQTLTDTAEKQIVFNGFLIFPTA